MHHASSRLYCARDIHFIRKRRLQGWSRIVQTPAGSEKGKGLGKYERGPGGKRSEYAELWRIRREMSAERNAAPEQRDGKGNQSE